MLIKSIPIIAMVFLAACSSGTARQSDTKASKTVKQATTKNLEPEIKYTQGDSKLVPVNAVASSNNECIDNFNFLRQAGEEKYHKYSQDYTKIDDGYNFLNVNKNIMDVDAKRIYTMNLDMKLDTLCSEVNYAGYKVIKQKIKELYGI